MSKNLPLGLQDFRKIIENDFKYIDKTEYIYWMVTKPGAYFLSRPRRFGKSIIVAVLQELYSGSKELFKGLWIEDKWDWSRKHPVIRISFTSIGFQSLGLEAALKQELNIQAKTFGLSLENKVTRVSSRKSNCLGSNQAQKIPSGLLGKRQKGDWSWGEFFQ